MSDKRHIACSSFLQKAECIHFAAPPFQTGPAALGSVLVLAEDLKGVLETVHPFQKEGHDKVVSFFLDFGGYMPPPPFRLKCSGTAKPPLRNSSLSSEFTPQKRRGPEGPHHGLGCDLGLGADLEACPRNCPPVSKRRTSERVSFFLGFAAHRAAVTAKR